MFRIANGKHSQNNSIRCDETIIATKKYDGVDGTRQDQPPLLHFDFEYYSGEWQAEGNERILYVWYSIQY